MVSKEEYMNYIKELLAEENNKEAEKVDNKKSNNSVYIVALVTFLIVVIPAFVINPIAGILAFVFWLVCIVFGKSSGKGYSYYKKEYRKKAVDYLLKN